MKKILLSVGMLLAMASAHAELVQQFRDPTFSGNGWSTLDGAENVGRVHLAEALSYRALNDEARQAA